MHGDAGDLGQRLVAGAVQSDIVNEKLLVPINPDDARLASDCERIVSLAIAGGNLDVYTDWKEPLW
jgi:hypothetical protein